MRLGGRHPNQSLPKVVVPDTRVNAAYSVISTERVVSFIQVTSTQNSPAVFTARLELDVNST